MTGRKRTRSSQSTFVPVSAPLLKIETIAMMSSTVTRIQSRGELNIAASFASSGLLELLRDRLLLREQVQVLAASGLRVRAGHVEAAERVDADQSSRALAVEVQVADVELPLAALEPLADSRVERSRQSVLG